MSTVYVPNMTTVNTLKKSYLKKYLENSGEKKKKRRIKKRSNLAVHDDDIDWQSLTPQDENQSDVEENDPDEAPIIAEIKDDSVRRWQPVSSIGYERKRDKLQKRKRMDSPHVSREATRTRPRWEHVDDDVSPLRYMRSSSSDLSPQRGESVNGNEKKGTVSPVVQRRQQVRADYKRRRPPSPSLSSNKLCKQDSSIGRISTLPQQIEHTSRIDIRDQVTQEYNCSVNVIDSEENQSLPRSGEGILLHMKAVTSKTAHDKHHQDLDVPVYDHHETIYRDKEGHKIDLKLQAFEKEQRERSMHDEDEKFILWGRGIAQSKSAHEKLEDDLYEMSKPLARYAEDDDLERMLKERERDGDPMLAFIKKKSRKEQRELPKKEKPAFRGSAPPNRFGIKPGYRWDGVDRSNGFERAWFTRESNKKAFDEEAYKWSVEDM